MGLQAGDKVSVEQSAVAVSFVGRDVFKVHKPCVFANTVQVPLPKGAILPFVHTEVIATDEQDDP